ncbi:MAG: RHS repeat protein, partial [Proteobacteria bacterium]
VITEMTYHPRGWMTSRTVKGATTAGDRSTLIDYWPTGLVKRVTQADGSYTQYNYDAAHRIKSVADSLGNNVAYTLDNAGNRTGENVRDPSQALKRTLSRVYDQLGQLQSQSDAYSHATSYSYDANGNTDVVTDPLGRGTNNAYDPLNRLVQTIQDIGGIAATTQFKYDAQDNLTRVTDPKGLNTDYAYNGLGDLTQLTSPDTGVTTYTYDSAGNRAGQTDARLYVQAYTYDAVNRLTYITSPNRTYTYDNNNTTICLIDERFGKGRLTGLIDQSGNTRYCYNRFGDLVRKVQTTNSVVLTTRYGYDAAGRLATQTYPDGAVLDAVRDGEGRVVELGVTQNGGTRRVVVTGATYAPFGPNTGWTYGNGRSHLRTLNQNYQPLAIHDAAAGGLSLGFAFDAVGNLTLLQDGAQTTNLAQYGYDSLNRLAQVKDGPTGAPIDTYTYDATGNRASVLNAGVTTSYLYSTGSHRLDQVATVTRTYDASGNTTKIGGNARVFNYDPSGRLASTNTNGVRVRNYRYNAKGEQTWSDLAPDYRYFVYDEAGHLLGEYGAAGAPVQQVIWFGDLPVGVLQGSGISQQFHYIEPDHLGTPRVVIDGTRNVPIWTWGITGEAFGATPPNQDPDGDSTAFVFDLRYPGQRYDSATGLNYNYFRDYDPGTGRYVESDPIGLKGGISTFAYVSSSPLDSSDPSGLVTWKGRAAGFDAYAGVGAGIYFYSFESDCACGKKMQVTLHSGALGIGAG